MIMVRWLSHFTALLVLGLLCLAGAVHGQQAQQQGNASTTANAEQTDDVETTIVDSEDQGGADTSNSEEATAGDNSDDAPVGDSPSRFIPTEQVSQDLGVSFPADI